MMKKTIAILLSLVMILGLAACGNSASQTEQPSTEDTSVESKADTNAAENSTAEVETESEATQPDDTEATEPASETDTESEGTKVLVAYFSATNTTEGVAAHIANGLNADIYEIVPEDPYTEADLNYNDNNSRTTIEMNDPNARPAISGSVENMEQYDIIFVGYHFSGKTIVPFCTSGGSGIGSSASNLERLTSGATWLDGRRLNGSDSQDTVMEWVNSLDLNLAE